MPWPYGKKDKPKEKAKGDEDPYEDPGRGTPAAWLGAKEIKDKNKGKDKDKDDEKRSKTGRKKSKKEQNRMELKDMLYGYGAPPPGTEVEADKTKSSTIQAEEDKTDIELDKHLDYILFPNIMGWYFDGYFEKLFGLNEKYAEHFNKLQAEYDEREDYEHEETFTEKVYRFFWPPKFKMGCFRTRGIYLDFPEVIADPPKTPPDINYEHKREPIGIAGDDFEEDEDEEGEGPTKRNIVSKAVDKDELVKPPRRRRKKIRTIPFDREDRPAWINPSGGSPSMAEIGKSYKSKPVSWTSSQWTTCEQRINFERPHKPF